MSSHSDNQQDQTLTIIQTLADRERELAAAVERAKVDAEGMLEQARAKAAQLRDAAAHTIEQQSAEHRAKLAAIAAAIESQRGSQAAQIAEQLRARAQAKLDAAAAAVVDRVLPERD